MSPYFKLTLGCLAALLGMLLLCGCVHGIPPPDGWDPPKHKPCDKKINDVCYTNAEYAEWVRKNL